MSHETKVELLKKKSELYERLTAKDLEKIGADMMAAIVRIMEFKKK